jgi:HK97 gp10 family phage protein
VAKFTYEAPTDFLKQLGRLAKVDEIAPQMLNESIPVVKDKLQKELAWHVRTGKLQESIKCTKAKKVKDGHYVVAIPTGTDENGMRNIEKLVYLEYGTSKNSKQRQSPTPVIKTALNDSESTVLNRMQEVFTREANK